MWQDVLETYRCLISCREKWPGMSLEEVFKPEFDSVDALKREYAWLQQQASAANTKVQNGHIAQQPK
jgi:hypothetical protein